MSERVDDREASDLLPVFEILGQQETAFESFGGGHDQCVPEGELQCHQRYRPQSRGVVDFCAPMTGQRSRRRSPAAAYLASGILHGIKFGLETSRALADELGHPETAFPTLLVAGTNGKGSVVAYVDAALRASGLRVGRYTSPHLVRVNERIVVAGREISEAGLGRAILRVKQAAERLLERGLLAAHPTYFETLTLAAFDHFRRATVDVAVLEVGLGGRLDATNIAEPLVSAIVSIDRDHERYLGTTLASIAREKAGVLRPGRPAVLGPMPVEARAAIAAEARRVGARLEDVSEDVQILDAAGALTITTPQARYVGVRPLLGVHQRANAAVAIRILEAARAMGIAVRPGAVAGAFAATRWPGRLQWLPGDPPVLLDGAHNPAGARALAAYLEGQRPFVLLFGVMGDKAVSGMAQALFPLAEAIVLTRPPIERAASPEAIAQAAGRVARGAEREPRLAGALRRAKALARERSATLVVAGSLYLVGAVLRLRIKSRK
jgi:dihydrofolate synthase/folylpolyglutamate synthase